MRDLYWVGTRQSDIEETGSLFKGSITIFGDGTNGNIAFCSNHDRINHNLPSKECDEFFKNTLLELCEQNDSIRFMFYNPILAYELGDKIVEHTICLNPFELLEEFSDKRRSRTILRNITEILPHTVLLGSDCSYQSLCHYFTGFTEFVIQEAISSGGEGTYHINASSNYEFINPDEEYIVSPYINNALSLNTHIIITGNQVIYLPSSVQISIEIDKKLLYCGGDYVCFNSLSKEIKELVSSQAKKIGSFAQKRGYRGVLGIDFILKEKTLYFVELNARFQASSQLINKALQDQCNSSLQEINYLAFEGEIQNPFVKLHVDYSSFIYTNQTVSNERLKRIYSSPEVLQVQFDGYNANQPCQYPSNKSIYLNRCVFKRNIYSVNNSRHILHPNIYCEDIKPYLSVELPDFKANTKIALLNHGVLLTESAIDLAKQYGRIKDAVFDAIDISIFNKVYINAPCNCKFNSISPFTIEARQHKFVLLCDEFEISEVEISFVPDALDNKYAQSGVAYDAVINLATDRIRINPAPVCYYKLHGTYCKFCNLPFHNESYGLTDIKEMIDYCLDNVAFRHFLIGGGTYAPDESGWKIISEIARHIRHQSDKDIYLMSIPPAEKEDLIMLKDSGITEVAFNIEIFDRKIAIDYMPGKGSINYEQYMSALTYAVSLWGREGKVRSLLIYGFDSDERFIDGIAELCKMGVEPIISVFRPLEGTDFSELNPPPTLDVISMYKKCQSISQKYRMNLGPDCPMCQNNTLSFTEVN